MTASVQSRILLGYFYLMALVVLVAAGASVSFLEFSSTTERILAENYESVQAGSGMLLALERQDRAVIGLLLGEDRRDLLDRSTADFFTAYARAAANVTLAGEAGVVDTIGLRFAELRERRDRLLESRPESLLSAYGAETFAASEAVKVAVFDLIDMNHDAMVEASDQAQRSATRRAVLAGILVLVGILSFGLLSRALRRDILERLQDLRAVAAAIAGGDRRRRAIAVRDDELGMVAGQLNALLDLQQETESRIESRLMEARLALRGLVAGWREPVALFLLSGELVASSLDESDTTLALLAAASPSLPRGEESAEGAVEREEGGRRYAFRLIRAPEGQRVGWLATRVRG